MAIWRYTQGQGPQTYCENLSISLRDLAALLRQLYESYGGGSVFEFNTFLVLESYVEAIAIEAQKASEAYLGMELRPKRKEKKR